MKILSVAALIQWLATGTQIKYIMSRNHYLPHGSKTVDCVYEVLFSQTRPPNITNRFPEHTITMACTENAIRLYLRDETTRLELEKAIISGKIKSVTLNEKVLGIQEIQHLEGWPRDPQVDSYMYCVPIEMLAKAKAHIPLQPNIIYETDPPESNVGVVGYAPVHTVEPFFFDRKAGMLNHKERVTAKTNDRNAQYAKMVVFLCDSKVALAFRNRLRKSSHTVVTLNDCVRAVILVPWPDTGRALRAIYAVDDFPTPGLEFLISIGLQKQAGGFWTKENWTTADNNKLPI
jgi:hypothetical protein